MENPAVNQKNVHLEVTVSASVFLCGIMWSEPQDWKTPHHVSEKEAVSHSQRVEGMAPCQKKRTEVHHKWHVELCI